MFATLGSSFLYAPNEEKQFLSWMRTTNLLYTGEEYHLRLGIFMNNKRYIEEFNRQGHSFTLGLNDFAAMTTSERRSRLGTKKQFVEAPKRTQTPKPNIPESFDWRARGVVGDIKDQGLCGSCWAFGPVGVQESMHAITHSENLVLSEQNVVDCMWWETCLGCEGGNPDHASLEMIDDQDGRFMLEADYPYTAKTGFTCKYDATKVYTHLVKIVYAKIDENDMAERIATYGPLVSCMDAGYSSFDYYFGGVYSEPLCGYTWEINHCVILVGYGYVDDSPVWILRNSYGVRWGIEGYMTLIRGQGMCNIDLNTYNHVVD